VDVISGHHDPQQGQSRSSVQPVTLEMGWIDRLWYLAPL